MSLDVLNGTSVTGLAGQNGNTLRATGFHVDTVDSTDPTAATTIEYPDGTQAGAKAVSAGVPGTALVETGSVQKVALVLGSNGVQARALGHPAPSPGHSAHPAPPGQPNCIN